MNGQIECIVPAAGLSTRMGRWKPAIEWNGMPLVRYVVSRCLRWCASVTVVTGYREAELRDLLTGLARVRFVHNTNYQAGMFSSIQSGLTAIAGDSFLVFMADMPRVPDTAFEAVLSAECEAWVRPVYGEQRLPGHPVRISKRIVPELLALSPETGSMKTVLRRYRGVMIPIDDPGVVFDADRPGDLSS